MLPYISCYVVATLNGLFSKTIKLRISHNREILVNTFLFSFFIFGLLIGFRDSIALDDGMYIRAFNQAIRTGETDRTIEYSYVLICRIFAYLHLNYQAVFLFYSVGGALLIGKAFCKIAEQNEYVLVFALFWAIQFTNLMTAMRQFLAIGLVVNAYLFFKEQKKTKCIIFALLSIAVHVTAIAALLLLTLIPLVRRIKYQARIAILVSLYILQYIPFASIFTDLMGKISVLQSNYYVRYFLVTGAKWIFTDPLGINDTIILILTMLVMWYVNENKELFYSCSVGKIKILSFADIESLCFLYWAAIMFLNQFGFLRRIIWFLSCFATVYIVKGLRIFSKDNRWVVRFVVFLFFFAIFVYSLTIYPEQIIPYRWNYRIFAE